MDHVVKGKEEDEEVKESAETSQRVSQSFRSFREALMTKHFEAHDNSPIQVFPKLFIGSYGAAMNQKRLEEHGITHIVCVSPSLQFRFPEAFEYLRIEISDAASEKISLHFNTSNAFINRGLRTGGSVLVHCFAGKSRSATILIAYLIACHRMKFEEALGILQKTRPQAQPNSGFVKQLIAFEKQFICF